MLGAVWSPCVGPTLGAASVLAARAENLTYVALTIREAEADRPWLVPKVTHRATVPIASHIVLETMTLDFILCTCTSLKGKCR